MCGIVGFIAGSAASGAELRETVSTMRDVLHHRGPDDLGAWVDEHVGVAMGHARLSIIDLSEHGHQPMHSKSGRYVAVYNGEIYNFIELQSQLKRSGFRFEGHSDTEVLLAAVETWGLDTALQRFSGMFALALWDKIEHKLYLARDRIGEKPLYYGWQGNAFLFGSELKALRLYPQWQGEINRDALALYMRHNCIPAPYSIYKGVHKLVPGTVLCLSPKNPSGHCPEPVAFWSVKDVVERGVSNPFQHTDEEATRQLESLLRETIREKMVADVPLGAFLSGGIDSSLVVALMQAESSQEVKTFSIGFHEAGYNEAQYAKAVAEHLGTDHTELYVTSDEARSVIPLLPGMYDEPFADSSQIPTYLVSKMTRGHVSVALSGDGGDELFGGYNRYFHGRQIWQGLGWIPPGVRGGVASLLTSLPPGQWDRLLGRLLPHGTPGDKLYKLADMLASTSPEDMYYRLVSHWRQPEDMVIGATEPITILTDQKKWPQLNDFATRMMFLDSVSYLPDDILVKLDRASMAVSLESRVPFLDHRVVEFAWKLPLHQKLRGGVGKWILRQILYRHVPQKLIERPKMGFGIPVDAWLRGPLREWAEDLLSERRIREEGFFDPTPIRQKWQEHLSGRRNWQYLLWDVLMFQAWKEKWER